MGILARAFERRDTTFQTVWGADLEAEASPLSVGRRITRDQALGLSAVFACVRLLADTVATLPAHVYEDHGGRRLLVDPQPDWLWRPSPRDPSVSWIVHLQQVMASLLLDGNAFVLVSPDVADPAELRVLDPRRVEIIRRFDGSVVYRVRDHAERVVDDFDWTRIIHIPLIRLAGELRGVSPLEAERRVFDAALQADELGVNFLRNGAWLSAIVEAPAGVSFTKEQADELMASIERKYGGAKKAGKIGLLTGGATIKPLSITPEQAQFIETKQLDDERIIRIFRCPPALLGMTRAGAVSYASSVEQALAFEKHTIRPLVEMIEHGYATLQVRPRYLKLNTAGLLRGDPKTRYEGYRGGIESGVLVPNDVRALEDQAPIEGGDRPRVQLQYVDPTVADGKVRADTVSALVAAGMDLPTALRTAGLALPGGP